MKNKYLFFNTIVTLIALIFMFVLGILVTKQNNIKQAEENIINLTEAYALNYNGNNDAYNQIDNDIRITIVSSTGEVLMDNKNEVSSLENHITREEIVSALNGESKVFIRKSNSNDIDMIYYAVKIDISNDYIFFRLSMPISTVNSYVINTIPLMIMILLCSLTISFIISIILGTKMIKPLNDVRNNLRNLNRGVYNQIMPNTSDDDINKIIIEINDIGDKLNNNIIEIKDKQNKLDYILNKINSAILTFDRQENINLMNDYAKRIFNLQDEKDKKLIYLALNSDFLSIIRMNYQNNNDDPFEIILNGRIYVSTVSEIDDNHYMLVMNDFTESKNNEKIRSEFFSNASHELKTPLTSIKAFTEIMMFNSKDDTTKSMLLKIDKESNRILAIVNDMLKLERLETLKGAEKNDDIQLRKIVQEVLDELNPLIITKKIVVNVIGDNTIKGDKEDFYTLFKNLIENSIKYNNDNGKIDVILSKKDKNIIEIKDNGIGIDPKDQPRVFERFYRIDKSRSRLTGGTGLGLAIVKHIVEIYHGTIDLYSELGKGTDIIIRL